MSRMVEASERAQKLAYFYMTPGSIGRVLARFATTGQAPLDELLDDIRRTRAESPEYEADMDELRRLVLLANGDAP